MLLGLGVGGYRRRGLLALVLLAVDLGAVVDALLHRAPRLPYLTTRSIAARRHVSASCRNWPGRSCRGARYRRARPSAWPACARSGLAGPTAAARSPPRGAA